MGVRNQLYWAARFAREHHTRYPALAIWVATFSGSLHEPLTPYFMLELDAQPAMMGRMYAVQTMGTLCLSPLYGYLLDMHLVVLPSLASGFCCAIGCLVRGLCPKGDMFLLLGAHIILGLGAANFWNVVGAYLAMSFQAEDRTQVVGAFRLQIQVLSLLGKSLYTPWDSMLLQYQDDTLTRYRISMSVCSVLCIFGVFLLAVNRHTLQRPAEVERKLSKELAIPVSGVDSRFVVFCVAFFMQSTAMTMFNIMWPLYLKDTYAWGAREYALASLGISLGSIALMTWGTKSKLLVPSLLLATVLAATSRWIVDVTVHVVVGILLASLMTLQRPLFEAKGSLLVAPNLQGRAIMILAVSQGLGGVIGNWTAPLLESWFLPAIGVLCAGSCVALVWTGSSTPYTALPEDMEMNTTPVEIGRARQRPSFES
eukprot:GEMP01039136.1.p1 GENE.GEMP01039136.1~~GEMP01039136.1.p1  ORF type:complete len:426 (+),score=78.38 GEMP01039136.1:179-1456(+)